MEARLLCAVCCELNRSRESDGGRESAMQSRTDRWTKHNSGIRSSSTMDTSGSFVHKLSGEAL